MNENKFNPEHIDSYLRNELPEKERLAFEEMCENDPVLRSEIQFQKEIVTALQNYRKAELKQRLNMVAVDYPLTVAPWIGYLKITAISLGFVGALSFTSLYFWDYSSNEQTSVLLNKAGSQATHKIYPSEKRVSKDLKTNDVSENTGKQELDNHTLVADSHEKTNNPVFENKNDVKAHYVSPVTVQEMITNKVDEDDSADITAGQETLKNNHLLYQYHNDRVIIQNNSGGVQFTITIDGKTRFFLLYDNVFYDLEPDTEEFKELKPVTDSLILNNLNIQKEKFIRNKKY